MNRRDFLGVGAATAALTVAGPVSAIGQRRSDIIAVFDSRFKEARRFAKVATDQHGLLACGFAGDATALWHEQLIGALARGTSVVGLTAGGARFCLQLIASPGTRFIHHVTHTVSNLAAPHACWTGEKGVDQELRCAQDWPEQAARLAVRQALKAPDRRNRLTLLREYPLHQLPAADHLESWVLAPAPAAARGHNRLRSDWNS